MMSPKQSYYNKRGQMLVKKLQSHFFEAYYCENREEALKQALALIPEGASVGWGGTVTAEEIGLLNAVRTGPYRAIDRDTAKTPEERGKIMKQALLADVFIASANAISMDGQLVNVDNLGNRVAALIYGPESVIVVAGMNKTVQTQEDAVARARTIAAPMNAQRFPIQTPCQVTGTCADCKSPDCICSQILVTRQSKPAGRIKVILVGEDLGM